MRLLFSFSNYDANSRKSNENPLEINFHPLANRYTL